MVEIERWQCETWCSADAQSCMIGGIIRIAYRSHGVLHAAHDRRLSSIGEGEKSTILRHIIDATDIHTHVRTTMRITHSVYKYSRHFASLTCRQWSLCRAFNRALSSKIVFSPSAKGRKWQIQTWTLDICALHYISLQPYVCSAGVSKSIFHVFPVQVALFRENDFCDYEHHLQTATSTTTYDAQNIRLFLCICILLIACAHDSDHNCWSCDHLKFPIGN